VIFGDDQDAIGLEIQRYFDLRRRYATPVATRGPADLDELVTHGSRVDSLIRARIGAQGARTGILGQLCRYDQDLGLTEDELVAHANILFMSSSEPIATAMTWILLGFTQWPTLRAEAREGAPLAAMVREFLRLVPPSAIIGRLTTRDVTIAGRALPAATEVLISPFAEHRRPDVFSDPLRFRPSRWAGERPGPFQFLPFGNGARSCLGKRVALATLERCTSALLCAADPVLACPQWLDWRMNVTLLPSPDPIIRFEPRERSTEGSDPLSGPSATMIGLPSRP
jgi:cytochrome P450